MGTLTSLLVERSFELLKARCQQKQKSNVAFAFDDLAHMGTRSEQGVLYVVRESSQVGPQFGNSVKLD